MIFWLPPNHGNGKRHMAWTFRPCSEKPNTGYTAHMRDPAFILVPHFAAKIMLITLFNQWRETPSLWLECQYTANKAKIVWVVYTVSWHCEGEWQVHYCTMSQTYCHTNAYYTPALQTQYCQMYNNLTQCCQLLDWNLSHVTHVT